MSSDERTVSGAVAAFHAAFTARLEAQKEYGQVVLWRRYGDPEVDRLRDVATAATYAEIEAWRQLETVAARADDLLREWGYLP